MTSKNPFEIRLDVMKMAQEMLDREHQTKMKQFQTTVDVMREGMIQGKYYDPEMIKTYIESNIPQTYTTAEVVNRSNELYNFVSSTAGARTIRQEK